MLVGHLEAGNCASKFVEHGMGIQNVVPGTGIRSGKKKDTLRSEVRGVTLCVPTSRRNRVPRHSGNYGPRHHIGAPGGN